MANIKNLRTEIDELDNALINLLERRFEITQTIGTIKKQQSLSIEHRHREDEILKKIPQSKYRHSLETIFRTLFIESKKHQESL